MPNNNAVTEGSETLVLRSDFTEKEYLISLGLPHLYHDEPGKKWPVVYLLDANYYFGMITDMVRSMSWCGMTRDAVVVGIGYATDAPLEEAWHQVMAWRTMDLTPERDEGTEKSSQEWLKRNVRTGGASSFAKFLEEELTTFVESNYRVDEQDRTLAGHSYGGLFTLYMMFHRPERYRNYIACSPSVGYKDQSIFGFEERYARRRKTLPVKLYMSAGELEGGQEDSCEKMNRLAAQLESRNYGRFAFETQVFPGEDHCTVIAPSLQAGLKRALKT
ncbi:MAG: alpha/beta hydrolase [Candidatus Promineifilaceae bacterium]